MNELFKEQVKNLSHGQNANIFFSAEAGGEVYKLNDVFVIFEIPLYGGKPQYSGTYKTSEEVFEVIERWI